MTDRYCKECKHISSNKKKCLHGNNTWVSDYHVDFVLNKPTQCKHWEAKQIRACYTCRFGYDVNNKEWCPYGNKSNNHICHAPESKMWQPRACGFCKHLEYKGVTLGNIPQIYVCYNKDDLSKHNYLGFYTIENAKEHIGCSHFQNRSEPSDFKDHTCKECIDFEKGYCHRYKLKGVKGKCSVFEAKEQEDKCLTWTPEKCLTCIHDIGNGKITDVRCNKRDGYVCSHEETWRSYEAKSCETCKHWDHTVHEPTINFYCNIRGGLICSKEDYRLWEAKDTTSEVCMTKEDLPYGIIDYGKKENPDTFFEDIEYLNIDGHEYINKHDKGCGYITCNEYQECRKQNFNVKCNKEFNKNKPNKEEPEMESVKKEIEKVNKEIEKVKKEREKYLIENIKEIKELFDRARCRTCGEYSSSTWYSLSSTFQRIVSKNLTKKEIKQLKKLRYYKGKLYYKRYRYDAIQVKLPRKEWNLLVKIIESCKEFKGKYLLDKEKTELCRLTDCYKALSDDKPKCPDCHADLPNDCKFCPQCGKQIERGDR